MVSSYPPVSGNNFIDDNHRDLLILIDDLSSLVRLETKGANFDSAIGNFLNSLDHHFQHEEVILQGAGYENLPNHIKQHRKISLDLRELQQQSFSANVGKEVVQTIRKIIFTHELADDQEYWPLFQFLDGSKPILIEWNTKIETGDPMIDEHHKSIINFVNRLAQNVFENKEFDQLSSELKQLCTYTEFHFAEEEQHFSSHLSDAEKASHKAQHIYLIEDMKTVIKKIELGSYNQAAIPDYLKYWFLNHIQRFDKPTFAINQT